MIFIKNALYLSSIGKCGTLKINFSFRAFICNDKRRWDIGILKCFS